jgi:hypothetical protein
MKEEADGCGNRFTHKKCHEAVGINPREPVARDEGTKNEEPKRLRDTSSCGKWS